MNRHDPEVSAALAAADLTDAAAAPGRDHGGIQSVDIGMAVLKALAQAKGPMSLKEIGAACSMAPSKAHRYLHSLVASGLVAQQKRSGKYDLGIFALRLGHCRHSPHRCRQPRQRSSGRSGGSAENARSHLDLEP